MGAAPREAGAQGRCQPAPAPHCGHPGAQVSRLEAQDLVQSLHSCLSLCPRVFKNENSQLLVNEELGLSLRRRLNMQF